MNNEEIKKSAARAVPVSTLSTYVAAPAAPTKHNTHKIGKECNNFNI